MKLLGELGFGTALMVSKCSAVYFFQLKLFLWGRTGYLEVLNPCFPGR
jgi:hypothetical protein